MIQKVRKVTYKLELPSESKIHPIFHVSQLKRKLGIHIQTQHQAPADTVEQIVKPERTLKRRIVNKGSRAVAEVLIK